MESIYKTSENDRSKSGKAEGALTIRALLLPVLKVLKEISPLEETQYVLDQVIYDNIEKLMEIRPADRKLQKKQERWKYRIAWITNMLRNSRLIDKDNEDYSKWRINNEGVKFLEKYGLHNQTEISVKDAEKAYKEIINRVDVFKDDTESVSRTVIELIAKIKKNKVNVFRCATSGQWNNMRENNFVSMHYLSADEHKTVTEWKRHSSRGKNSVKAWVNSFKKNDYIIIISKNEYYGIAKCLDDFSIENDARYDYGDHQVLGRKVEYIHALDHGVNHGFKGIHNNPATFSKCDYYGFNLDLILNYLDENYPEALEELEESLDEKAGNSNKKQEIKINNFSNPGERKDIPKNIILYGPPGTGKTYNTVNRAVAILRNEGLKKLEDIDRTELKSEFDKLVKSKQIFFSTFHQSMSYEDFVEGIKPAFNPEEKDDEQNIQYEIKGGIFKIASAYAAYNAYKYSHEVVLTKKEYSFEELYEAYIEKARKGIKNQKLVICTTINNKEVEIFDINKNDSIRARSKGSIADHVAPLTKENIQKLYDRFSSIEEIQSLSDVKETVEVSPRTTEFYAVFKSLKEFENKEFAPDTSENKTDFEELEEEEIIRKFESGVFTKASRKYGKVASPIVLIIDEINRGNVSAIFGELITLLEDDKRGGEDNEITATLLYSKKDFYVPTNLYLIGTMNTADRSVEALDTALRRRFSFIEMMPRHNKITMEFDNIKLSEVLKTINARIELLVDRDHTIGHAYFMKVKNENDLANAFNDKILPLLQEYFYGDYGKIGLVLGNSFVERNENKEKEFSNFKYSNKRDFITDTFKLNKVTEDNEKEAIKNLLMTDKKAKENKTQEQTATSVE